jgi:hypothetical protein
VRIVFLELEHRIVQAVLSGADLDVIEATIIDPAPVDEEQKSALWLYAEALQEQRQDGMLTDHEPALIGT